MSENDTGSITESGLVIHSLSDYFTLHDIDKSNYKLEYFLKPENVNLFHKHGIFTVYQLLGSFLILCNEYDFEPQIPAFKTWLEKTILITNEKSIQFITDLVYNKLYILF